MKNFAIASAIVMLGGPYLLMADEPREIAHYTCSLSRPLEGSKITYTHGVNLSEYPPVLPTGFTGCKSVWLEDGSLLMRGRFESGTIVAATLQEPGERRIECLYANGERLATANNKCPEGKDLQ